MTNMTAIKSLIKSGKFVVVPTEKYEALLRSELDRDLAISLQQVREGNVSPAFDTAEEAIKFLEARRKARRK